MKTPKSISFIIPVPLPEPRPDEADHPERKIKAACYQGILLRQNLGSRLGLDPKLRFWINCHVYFPPALWSRNPPAI